MMLSAPPPMFVTDLKPDDSLWSVVRNDGRDAIFAFPAHEEKPYG